MNKANSRESWRLHCPIPISGTVDRITLAYGEGGRLMRRLVRERIISVLGNEVLLSMSDAAVLPKVDGRLALTTDSYVVSPPLPFAARWAPINRSMIPSVRRCLAFADAFE